MAAAAGARQTADFVVQTRAKEPFESRDFGPKDTKPKGFAPYISPIALTMANLWVSLRRLF
jgi:hypothetical protein